MKKKIISAVLSLVMLFSLMQFGVFADDEWQVNWRLNRTGELTVTGSGALPDNWVRRDNGNSWYSRRSDIKSAVVESGFTSLGAGVFADCPELTKVTIPATVTKLGAGAFENSSRIEQVVYGGTETAWKDAVSSGVSLPATARVLFQNQPSPSPDPAPTPAPSTQPSVPPGDASFRWSLTKEGDLVVTGNGQIPDGWVATGAQSWKPYLNRIRTAFFGDGITYLGSGTLSNMPNLTLVTIPASVAALNHDLFTGSSAVRDVFYGGTEAAWIAAGGEHVRLPDGAKLHFDGHPSPASPFADVSAEHYFAPAVSWAVARSITAGTDKTHFSPDLACTRAQAVTFLWRAKGCPEPTGGPNPFVDVRADDYFYKAVLWAAQTGVTAGTDKTHFSPDLTCTRAQVVTFLWRVEGESGVPVVSTFSDVPADAYYAAAVSWAVSRGITAGTDKTHFSPDLACSRAQIVTFLWRALK